ncbi:hypothetical protein Nos7524_4484 [Nostoc sp. PCC 7524]|uniref:hypothetical protein n=1 Tax=Nostoc sp. (strain ATCC 29411 / PCC 7524) TaxID=28072 RepID=UPI00029F0D72|nr:hypothetical protein [Nostoc sp. PCC 7524]AFY50237.1 hypothetical protein Nos7524_4484 [Nostoc sp. PCC 7524]
MSIKTFRDHDKHQEKQSENTAVEFEFYQFINKFKTGVWVFGIPSWLFGITDRSMAAFADGYLSATEILQIFTTSFFFLVWLYLKPEDNLDENTGINQYHGCSCLAQTNKFDLKKRHMISQEYILPFPYLCQIYHLLNLKHLETVHNFSLNNLKILNVSDFRPTNIGGIIKFQTLLDSPMNALRIWRQPIVEVDLILHTPYTIELSIPVYDNKRIIVIFYAFPLNEKEHQLFIEIYSDLEWPKPILQILLHFASCLTLFEDLPYLRNLAEIDIEHLFKVSRFPRQANMLLFKRFVELYGSSREKRKLIAGSD